MSPCARVDPFTGPVRRVRGRRLSGVRFVVFGGGRVHNQTREGDEQRIDQE
jgi:hypothetical protein